MTEPFTLSRRTMIFDTIGIVTNLVFFALNFRFDTWYNMLAGVFNLAVAFILVDQLLCWMPRRDSSG